MPAGRTCAEDVFLSGFYPDVLILNPVRPGKATMNAEIFCVNSKIQEYGYE